MKEKLTITFDPKNPPKITEEERNLYRENNIPIIKVKDLPQYVKEIKKITKR